MQIVFKFIDLVSFWSAINPNNMRDGMLIIPIMLNNHANSVIFSSLALIGMNMYGTKKPIAKKKFAIITRRNDMLANSLKSPIFFKISMIMLIKRILLYQGELLDLF